MKVLRFNLKAQFIIEHSYESNNSCFKIELKAQFINEHSYESNKSCWKSTMETLDEYVKSVLS